MPSFEASRSAAELSAAGVLRSHVASGVVRFLTMKELCAAEAAGLDAGCILASWVPFYAAARSQLGGKPLWRAGCDRVAPAAPKSALRDLLLLSRRLLGVNANWDPCIRQWSDSCIEISPRPGSLAGLTRGQPRSELAGQAVKPDFGVDLGRPEHASVLEPQPQPPGLVVVPLAIGFRARDVVSVGVKFTAKRFADVGEAVMLGVEYDTTSKAPRTREGFLGLYFSPVSGRIFMRFDGETEGLVAKGLPALAEEFEAAQEIEVRMSVSKSGGVSFGRCCGRTAGVEMSAELPLECVPKDSNEIFASLAFQVDKLEERASASIAWVDHDPPAAARPCAATPLEAVWAVHEWHVLN